MSVFISNDVFQFDGGRELVDIDRVKILLNSIDKNIDPIQICLSNKSFSSEAGIYLIIFIISSFFIYSNNKYYYYY